MKKLVITLGLLAGQSALVRADGPAKQTLTFQKAIDVALGESPDILSAKQDVNVAEARAASRRANRWFTLNVESNLDWYKDPYILDFGAILGGGMSLPFSLHGEFTSATIVQLNQPLTGLAWLQEQVDAQNHATRAAHHDFDRQRLETAYRTADAYINVLEARANAVVAHQQVDDLQSELDRAKQLRAADVNTDIDVLRFQSRKAGADLEALKADAGAQTALSVLIVQLGLPDGAPVDIVDDLPATPPPLGTTVEAAQQKAIATRPELAAVQDQIDAANAQRVAAWERYLPSVNGVAQYQHLTGVQPFEKEDEYFLGLTVQWQFWNWGVYHRGVQEAQANQARAEVAKAGLLNNVKLEARNNWVAAKTAYDSLAVAQTELQAAEEALRLQKVRFDNQAATTTDVLDAQTDAARARLSFATARLDYYRALVLLARSIGDLPAAPGSAK